MAVVSIDSTQRSSCSETNPGFTYAVAYTDRGEVGLSLLRSPARSRSMKSGLTPPPPVPAASAFSRLPSAAVPPKPYGEIGEISVIVRTGWSSAYCMTTPAPMLQPTRCAGSRSSSVSTSARSSLKSRMPRVPSTGATSLSP